MQPDGFEGGYWEATAGNRGTLVYVVKILPWGALLRVRYAAGWMHRVVTSDTLASWDWRYVDVEEAKAWPDWKLQ
jgi:hypothetical protein